MSFAGSTQITMDKPVSKLLLRRNTTPVVLPDDIEQNTSVNDAEIALLDHESSNNDSQNHHQPAPSHKRKQSDTVALSNVEKIWAGDYSINNLESVLDGDDGDDEDGLVNTHPLTASFDGVASGQPYLHGNSVFFLEQKWYSSYARSGKMIAAVILSVALLSLRSYAAHNNSNTVFPDQVMVDEDSDHMEIIGDPMEAHLPTNYNWVEYYNDVRRVGPLRSTGPNPVDQKIGGLHIFENVCVTNNVDGPRPPHEDTSMRGLIYFAKDKSVSGNPKRCVPCSQNNVHETWGETLPPGNPDLLLDHPCGVNGLHAMYASSVEDWNSCMEKSENRQLTIRNRQNQSPSRAEHVHFFQEPTLLLQFQANDRESALFDTLLTYLPHWHKYKNSYNDFPFERVLSHSVEGCLSHSRNWFCELTHQMGAFGHAKEILWESTDDTLYCFKSLYYNQMEYQRTLSHKDLLTKDVMDDFRDVLNRNFALPRPRDMAEIWKKDAMMGMTRPMKIVLYGDNEPNGQNEWKNLEKLVQTSRSMKKYHGIELDLVMDLKDRTIAEQARTFNEVDAIIMSTGDHMANAIFATDSASFVELGCGKQSLIGNDRFMSLILGNHKSVGKCSDGHAEGDACISCQVDDLGGSGNKSFTMTNAAFQAILDELVEARQAKISFLRDSR